MQLPRAPGDNYMTLPSRVPRGRRQLQASGGPRSGSCSIMRLRCLAASSDRRSPASVGLMMNVVRGARAEAAAAGGGASNLKPPRRAEREER